MHSSFLVIAGLLVLSSVACTVGPDYEPPDLAARTDPAWRAEDSSHLELERAELALWWERFGSDELSALAHRLVNQNLTLAEARQRVVSAGARRGLIQADRLPQVSGTAGYTRAGTGDESLNFQGPPRGQDVSVYSAGVNAAWEIDLWGRVARSIEAADAQIEVAVEDVRAATVSLLAELALAYVDATTLDARLEIARQSIALQEETLRLAQSRLDAGIGTRLEVEPARREYENARARVADLEQARAVAEHRVALLVGERPRDGLVVASAPLLLPEAIGIGLPADLLVRRADLRRSERRLARAVAQIGAAEAERYPRVSINGTLAVRARTVPVLTSGADALSYSFGPSLVIPLFTGGRIDQAVAIFESEAEEARLAFERFLLEAITEVENSASGVVQTRERLARLQAAADTAQVAEGLARQLYEAGSRSLQQLIDAQRAVVATRDAVSTARQAALAQTIQLYRALGGGWETSPPDPSRARFSRTGAASMKRALALIAVLALGAVLGVFGYRSWRESRNAVADDALRLHGNIDLRDAQLSFFGQEKIATVLVEEGDRVAADQVLATLQSDRLQAAIAGAKARIAAQQAIVDRLANGSRPEELQSARANLAAAQVRVGNAEQVMTRVETTAASGASSAQSLDDASAALAVAKAQLDVGQAALDLAVAGPREEDRRQAAATLDALRADLAGLERQLVDTELRAPAAGVIRTRILEPGEMASPERPVFTLALTDPKWVRAYVPEPDLGRVASGQRATIRSDSFGGRTYEGWVGFISPVAEFTPKAVETDELRTRLVYEVRVFARDPNDELRLGMPVTVDIETGRDSEPSQDRGR